MKRESRGQFKERMQQEGRWPEALAFREQLIAEGASGRDAQEKTVAKFQPLDGTQTAAWFTPPREKGAKRAKATVRPCRRKTDTRKRCDLRADLLWVYQNLDQAEPKGPPSAGAIALHREAQKNRWDFLTMLIQRLVPPTAKEGKGHAPADDGTQSLELVDRLLGELDETRKGEADAVGTDHAADSPGDDPGRAADPAGPDRQ